MTKRSFSYLALIAGVAFTLSFALPRVAAAVDSTDPIVPPAQQQSSQPDKPAKDTTKKKKTKKEKKSEQQFINGYKAAHAMIYKRHDYAKAIDMLKALAPDPARVAHCWFHSEAVTWFHLLAAPVAYDDAVPFEPLELEGRPLPWRDVGGVVIAFLQARQPFDASQLARMRFLR